MGPLLRRLLHHGLIVDHIVSVRIIGLVGGMRSRSFALLSLVKQNLMRIDTPTILINKFGAITADNVVEWASRTMR